MQFTVLELAKMEGSKEMTEYEQKVIEELQTINKLLSKILESVSKTEKDSDSLITSENNVELAVDQVKSAIDEVDNTILRRTTGEKGSNE